MTEAATAPLDLPPSVTAPIWIATAYLTGGRVYPVIDWKGIPGEGAVGFVIADDQGDRIYCSTRNCPHLGGRDWIIGAEVHDYAFCGW